MPTALQDGIHAFNRGAYFECHEILEALWLATDDTEARAFYQGLIQLAVACYKLTTQPNFVGARNKLRKALVNLTPLCGHSPWSQWIDLDQLVKDSRSLETQLLRLGAAGFHTLDPRTIPTVTQPASNT